MSGWPRLQVDHSRALFRKGGDFVAKCDYLGHMWKPTLSPGWFRCERAVGVRHMKQERMAARLVYCGAMGYCPVCLGHLLSPVYAVVRCADHARLDLSTLAAR
jgi:hypothetical protein